MISVVFLPKKLTTLHFMLYRTRLEQQTLGRCVTYAGAELKTVMARVRVHVTEKRLNENFGDELNDQCQRNIIKPFFTAIKKNLFDIRIHLYTTPKLSDGSYLS
jgi:hypothetical protein